MKTVLRWVLGAPLFLAFTAIMVVLTPLLILASWLTTDKTLRETAIDYRAVVLDTCVDLFGKGEPA